MFDWRGFVTRRKLFKWYVDKALGAKVTSVEVHFGEHDCYIHIWWLYSSSIIQSYGGYKIAAAKRTGLLRFIQTQEHPTSKAGGNTRRGGARAAADTKASNVAACAHRQTYRAPRCHNRKNLAVGVIERT
jgi:hypothetical protein